MLIISVLVRRQSISGDRSFKENSYINLRIFTMNYFPILLGKNQKLLFGVRTYYSIFFIYS
ncbi:protein of unknown function [Oenococcus oeni]|nr:hypothetical protein OENI_490030 [Oenococcus oeni]SYW18710.1 hypothetical protein OENI_50057 [Oenococcus oeni]VDC14379.1 protein of unknown function [Oenococcus oeni]